MWGVTLLFAEYEFSVITGAFHAEVRKRNKALRIFVIFISLQIKFSMVSRSLHLFIRRVIKEIVVVMEANHFCQLHTKFYPTSCCQG